MLLLSLSHTHSFSFLLFLSFSPSFSLSFSLQVLVDDSSVDIASVLVTSSSGATTTNSNLTAFLCNKFKGASISNVNAFIKLSSSANDDVELLTILENISRVSEFGSLIFKDIARNKRTVSLFSLEGRPSFSGSRYDGKYASNTVSNGTYNSTDCSHSTSVLLLAEILIRPAVVSLLPGLTQPVKIGLSSLLFHKNFKLYTCEKRRLSSAPSGGLVSTSFNNNFAAVYLTLPGISGESITCMHIRKIFTLSESYHASIGGASVAEKVVLASLLHRVAAGHGAKTVGDAYIGTSNPGAVRRVSLESKEGLWKLMKLDPAVVHLRPEDTGIDEGSASSHTAKNLLSLPSEESRRRWLLGPFGAHVLASVLPSSILPKFRLNQIEVLAGISLYDHADLYDCGSGKTGSALVIGKLNQMNNSRKLVCILVPLGFMLQDFVDRAMTAGITAVGYEGNDESSFLDLVARVHDPDSLLPFPYIVVVTVNALVASRRPLFQASAFTQHVDTLVMDELQDFFLGLSFRNSIVVLSGAIKQLLSSSRAPSALLTTTRIRLLLFSGTLPPSLYSAFRTIMLPDGVAETIKSVLPLPTALSAVPGGANVSLNVVPVAVDLWLEYVQHFLRLCSASGPFETVLVVASSKSDVHLFASKVLAGQSGFSVFKNTSEERSTAALKKENAQNILAWSDATKSTVLFSTYPACSIDVIGCRHVLLCEPPNLLYLVQAARRIRDSGRVVLLYDPVKPHPSSSAIGRSTGLFLLDVKEEFGVDLKEEMTLSHSQLRTALNSQVRLKSCFRILVSEACSARSTESCSAINERLGVGSVALCSGCHSLDPALLLAPLVNDAAPSLPMQRTVLVPLPLSGEVRATSLSSFMLSVLNYSFAKRTEMLLSEVHERRNTTCYLCGLYHEVATNTAGAHIWLSDSQSPKVCPLSCIVAITGTQHMVTYNRCFRCFGPHKAFDPGAVCAYVYTDSSTKKIVFHGVDDPSTSALSASRIHSLCLNPFCSTGSLGAKNLVSKLPPDSMAESNCSDMRKHKYKRGKPFDFPFLFSVCSTDNRCVCFSVAKYL